MHVDLDTGSMLSVIALTSSLHSAQTGQMAISSRVTSQSGVGQHQNNTCKVTLGHFHGIAQLRSFLLSDMVKRLSLRVKHGYAGALSGKTREAVGELFLLRGVAHVREG
jgi:hypothetical protein